MMSDTQAEVLPVASLQKELVKLSEVVRVFWRYKWGVLLLTCGFAGAALYLSLKMPNVYQATALLAPTESGNASAMSGLQSSLGGLASLTGISFGSSQVDQTSLALAVVKTTAFLSQFAQNRDLIVPLFASSHWDAGQQQWVIDAKRYDVSQAAWRDIDGRSSEPSAQTVAQTLKQSIHVNEDRTTGLVTLSIESQSPLYAKIWLEYLIEDINRHMRQKDILEAERSIRYLQDQMQKTSLNNMQQVFYRLIESQTKTIMLANAKEGYVFQMIDPPVIPESKLRPKRKKIIMLSTLAGFSIGVLGVFLLHFFRSETG